MQEMAGIDRSLFTRTKCYVNSLTTGEGHSWPRQKRVLTTGRLHFSQFKISQGRALLIK